MENYVTQPNMKTNIMHVALKLFYDYGYKATSFEQIAKECEITKPLITHHYMTKANLANEINLYINKKRKNVVTRKIYDYYGTFDAQTGAAVEMRLNLEMLKQDDKAYRFYHERVNANFDSVFTEGSIPLYEALDRTYHLDLDRNIDELTMCALGSKAAGAALTVSFFSGKINCSFEDFCDYSIKLPFKLMMVPQEHIKTIIFESKKIITEVDFQLAPYYEIL